LNDVVVDESSDMTTKLGLSRMSLIVNFSMRYTHKSVLHQVRVNFSVRTLSYGTYDKLHLSRRDFLYQPIFWWDLKIEIIEMMREITETVTARSSSSSASSSSIVIMSDLICSSSSSSSSGSNSIYNSSSIIGHKIISIIIDSHFIDFITNQFISTLTQFDSSTNIITNYFKIECEILIEMCYYLLSIGLNQPTVGMSAVGINPVIDVVVDSNSGSSDEGKVGINHHQLLLVIYYMIKFTFSKLSYISIRQQWDRSNRSSSRSSNSNNSNGSSSRSISDIDDDSWKRMLSRVLYYSDMIFKFIGLGHYVSFLIHGDYPLISYRLLGIKMMMMVSVMILMVVVVMMLLLRLLLLIMMKVMIDTMTTI
jgi:hypothetical protein